MRGLILVFLALLLGLTAPARAQSQLEGIEAELDAARAAFHAPGLAVAVVVGGEVALAAGFGQRGLGDPAPVDARTRFAIGSCTKAFTAFAAGLLIDDGELSLSDRAATRDPMLRLSRPGALERLTVGDLLAQRSGLARHDFLWHARPELSRAAFAAAQGDLAMRAAPGEAYGYTNSGYILAGRIIELAAGEPWETFTVRRIFTPLGMDRANFSAAGLAADPNAARATKRADGASRTAPWRDARLLGPAGSINASASDLGRWMLVHLGRGSIEGRRILAPETLETLWTPQGSGRRDDPDGGYAHGWRVDVWRGHRRVSHGGAIDGFRARVTLFPDAGVGVAVAANIAPTRLPEHVSDMLAERLLSLPRETDLLAIAAARDAAERAALAREPPLPPGRIARLAAKDPAIAPRAPAEALAGVYVHPAYGEIRIAPGEAGTPSITFGVLEGRLHHWRGDAFIARSTYPDDTLDEGEIVFEIGAEGAPSALTAMIDREIAPVRFAYQGPQATLVAEAAAEAHLTAAGRTGADVRLAAFAAAIGALALVGAGAFALRRRP